MDVKVKFISSSSNQKINETIPLSKNSISDNSVEVVSEQYKVDLDLDLNQANWKVELMRSFGDYLILVTSDLKPNSTNSTNDNTTTSGDDKSPLKLRIYALPPSDKLNTKYPYHTPGNKVIGQLILS